MLLIIQVIVLINQCEIVVINGVSVITLNYVYFVPFYIILGMYFILLFVLTGPFYFGLIKRLCAKLKPSHKRFESPTGSVLIDSQAQSKIKMTPPKVSENTFSLYKEETTQQMKQNQVRQGGKNDGMSYGMWYFTVYLLGFSFFSNVSIFVLVQMYSKQSNLSMWTPFIFILDIFFGAGTTLVGSSHKEILIKSLAERIVVQEHRNSIDKAKELMKSHHLKMTNSRKSEETTLNDSQLKSLANDSQSFCLEPQKPNTALENGSKPEGNDWVEFECYLDPDEAGTQPIFCHLEYANNMILDSEMKDCLLIPIAHKALEKKKCDKCNCSPSDGVFLRCGHGGICFKCGIKQANTSGTCMYCSKVSHLI